MEESFFSCRIFHADYYLADPIKNVDVTFSNFRCAVTKKVPVIRIFGATKGGQKTCLHMHGVFPYLLVPYPWKEVDGKYIHQLASSIDRALTVSSASGSSASLGNHQQHVFKIIPVEGIPFYGYHENKEIFLKIYMYNPGLIKRLSDLLLSGAIMNTVLQPHEAHVPYILQFLMDYHLYGMNFIHLRMVQFRCSGHEASSPSELLDPSCAISSKPLGKWNTNLIDKRYLNALARVSVCELECDAIAADILNKAMILSSSDLEQTFSDNPGLNALWIDEVERRRELGSQNSYPELSVPLIEERPQAVVHQRELRMMQDFRDIVQQHLSEADTEGAIQAGAEDQHGISDLSQAHTTFDHSQQDVKLCTSETRGEVNEEHVCSVLESSQIASSQSSEALNSDILTLLLKLASSQSTNPSSQAEFSQNDSLSAAQVLSQSLLHSSQKSLLSGSQRTEEMSLFSPEDTSPRDGGSCHSQKGTIYTQKDTSPVDPVTSGESVDLKSLSLRSASELFLPFSQTPSTPDVPLQGNQESPRDGLEIDPTSPSQTMDEHYKISPSQQVEMILTSSTNHTENLSDLCDPEEGDLLESLMLLQEDARETEIMSQCPWEMKQHTDADGKNSYSTSDQPGTSNDQQSIVHIPQLDGSNDHRAKTQNMYKRKHQKVLGTTRRYQLRRSVKSDSYSALVRSIREASTDVGGDVSSEPSDPPPVVATGDGGLLKENRATLVKRAKHSSMYPLIKRLKLVNSDPTRDISKQFEPDSPKKRREDMPSENKKVLKLKRHKKRAQSIRSTSKRTLPTSVATKNLTHETTSPQLGSDIMEGPTGIVIPTGQSNCLVCPGPSNTVPPATPDSDDTLSLNSEKELALCHSTPAPSGEGNPIRISLNIAKETPSSGSSRCSTANLPSPPLLAHYSSDEEKGQFLEIGDSGNNDFQLQLKSSAESFVGVCPESCSSAKIPDLVPVEDSLQQSFIKDIPPKGSVLVPVHLPPTLQTLLESSKSYGIPEVRHQTAYFSNPNDVPNNRSSVPHPKSKMPYELHSFDPPATTSKSSLTTRFHLSGINHWRTVIQVLYSTSSDDKASISKSSKSSKSDASLTKLQKYQQSIKQKASQYRGVATVIVPVTPPPSLAHLQLTFKPKGGRECVEKSAPVAEDLPSQSSVNSEKKVRDLKFSPPSSSHQRSTSDALMIPLASTPMSLLHPSPPKRPFLYPSPVGTRSLLRDGEGQACTDQQKELTTPKFGVARHLVQTPGVSSSQSWKRESSQIDGPTPKNLYGFQHSLSLPDEKPKGNPMHKVQYLTTLSVELHTQTRGDKLPDPEFDEVLAVFYMVHNDWDTDKSEQTGIIAINLKSGIPGSHLEYLNGCGVSSRVNIIHVASEGELFDVLVQIVYSLDPDILIGYEVEQLSWGYLIERGMHLNKNLIKLLSRTPDLESDRFIKRPDASRFLTDTYIVGRKVINVWRIMRNEIALTNYRFENIAYHVLHQRLPRYTFKTLSKWYRNSHLQQRCVVVEYYLVRCIANYQLLENFNIIERTSEFARLYGILFSSVLTRGTQFRVESMLLRLAHPKNFVAVSPSVQQRARMAAPEHVPLILEPRSGFYSDPVLVLDFQSLYPSIIIAYNYCFSTCLGRVNHLSKNDSFPFGALNHSVPVETLKNISEDVTIAPNGVAFVKPNVRRGIIPQMLEEILSTRIMVKSSLKCHKKDKVLEKILDARQVGLKLIANVTFGYTAAHFSGRMPCVEIGDSIVSKARETLDDAIRFVNKEARWDGQVIYGDTDSLFVLLKGVSKDEAFCIGEEIVKEVTRRNPSPVKLKFEKVYLPCLLETKKRYVGYMYETRDQVEPVFDAKGIETVRRDNCPAVPKILEKSLKLLFESKDMSFVKSYVQNQLKKLLSGQVTLNDYVFAKEYRGRNSYRPGACVPALELANKMVAADRRAEPRAGERVPYVIVYGLPGLPLIKLVRRPEDVLTSSSLNLNSAYYAEKQILPSLQRVFSLMGINVFDWYNELPALSQKMATGKGKRKTTLGKFFSSLHCFICGEVTSAGDICSACMNDKQGVAVYLSESLRGNGKKIAELNMFCQNCCGYVCKEVTSGCTSQDCPVFHALHRAKVAIKKTENVYFKTFNLLEDW